MNNKLTLTANAAAGHAICEDGDEVALMPPFSGGSGLRGMVRIQRGPFCLDDEVERLKRSSPSIGGIVTFLGTTRDHSRERQVARLESEHYPGMAEKKLFIHARGEAGVRIVPVLAALFLLIVHAPFASGGGLASRELKIAGASTILPAAELVGEGYRKKYGAPVRITGGGSMAGIESVLSGAADIGMVSRALRRDEKAGLDHATVGHDAVVFIVNSGNPVRELGKDMLKALYTGTIRNWKELGGRDEPVLLISKLPGRSTLEIFEEYTGLRHMSRTGKGPGGYIVQSAYEIGSNLESATLVGGLPGAIGYVSLGAALSLIEEGMPLKILVLEGIEATRENVMSGRYPVRRELNLVFKKNDSKVRRFIRFFLASEGQSILMDHGFIPVKGGKAR